MSDKHTVDRLLAPTGNCYTIDQFLFLMTGGQYMNRERPPPEYSSIGHGNFETTITNPSAIRTSFVKMMAFHNATNRDFYPSHGYKEEWEVFLQSLYYIIRESILDEYGFFQEIPSLVFTGNIEIRAVTNTDEEQEIHETVWTASHEAPLSESDAYINLMAYVLFEINNGDIYQESSHMRLEVPIKFDSHSWAQHGYTTVTESHQLSFLTEAKIRMALDGTAGEYGWDKKQTFDSPAAFIMDVSLNYALRLDDEDNEPLIMVESPYASYGRFEDINLQTAGLALQQERFKEKLATGLEMSGKSFFDMDWNDLVELYSLMKLL